MIAAAETQPGAADHAMTLAEVRAYRAGVEAVRDYAQSRVEDHQARVRRDPDRRWTVTLGLLGGFGSIVSHCDQMLAALAREDRS